MRTTVIQGCRRVCRVADWAPGPLKAYDGPGAGSDVADSRSCLMLVVFFRAVLAQAPPPYLRPSGPGACRSTDVDVCDICYLVPAVVITTRLLSGSRIYESSTPILFSIVSMRQRSIGTTRKRTSLMPRISTTLLFKPQEINMSQRVLITSEGIEYRQGDSPANSRLGFRKPHNFWNK
jgi:hypothetical protein